MKQKNNAQYCIQINPLESKRKKIKDKIYLLGYQLLFCLSLFRFRRKKCAVITSCLFQTQIFIYSDEMLREYHSKKFVIIVGQNHDVDMMVEQIDLIFHNHIIFPDLISAT